MIFITVGTSHYPFDRMLSEIDAVVGQSHTDEKVIAQVGCSSYCFRCTKVQRYTEIPYTKVVWYMTRARIVISHGGMGSIMLCLRYALNKPFVFPRHRELQEHIDNHQEAITRDLGKKGYLVTKNLRRYLIYPRQNSLRKIAANNTLVPKLLMWVSREERTNK